MRGSYKDRMTRLSAWLGVMALLLHTAVFTLHTAYGHTLKPSSAADTSGELVVLCTSNGLVTVALSDLGGGSPPPPQPDAPISPDCPICKVLQHAGTALLSPCVQAAPAVIQGERVQVPAYVLVPEAAHFFTPQSRAPPKPV